MTPEEAIARYAATRDAEAFASLVRQYDRLVYAAASRSLSRQADIEDATQQAFLNLARSAGDVRRNVAAWLYRAAQNAAADLIRRDATRRRHEASLDVPTSLDASISEIAEWRETSLAIDAAIAALPEADRNLVVEHFLAGRSQRDLATAFGMSQPTVQRRIERAVSKLREHLLAGGHGTIGVAMLTTHLPTLGAASVPTTVTAELTKIGLAAPTSKLLATGGAGLKVAAAAAIVSTAAAIGVAVVAPRRAAVPRALAAATSATTVTATTIRSRPATTPSARSATSPSDVAGALVDLAHVYRLADDEDVALVPPPYPPERTAYVNAITSTSSVRGFYTLFFSVNAGGLRPRLMLSSTDNSPIGKNLITPLENGFGLKWFDYDVAAINRAVDRSLRLQPFVAHAPDGDWLMRQDASPARVFAGLETVLTAWLGQQVRFRKMTERRPCIVLTGPATRPSRGSDWPGRGLVAITLTPLPSNVLDHLATQKPSDWVNSITFQEACMWIDAPFFDQSGSPINAVTLAISGSPIDGLRLQYEIGNDIYTLAAGGPEVASTGMTGLRHREPGYRERLRHVLDNIQSQIGGTWTIEDRDIETWTAVVAPAK